MHETAIIASMLEHEYPAFASILRELDIYEKSALDKPIEVQIVHYADARVYSDKLVSTQERFDDAVKRYRFDKDEKTLTSWKKFTNGIRAIEKRIFSKISMNPDELGSQLS